jgi:hypothetical protein
MLRELHEWCIAKSREYPQLESEIKDLYDLAEMEVEDGESVYNESELCKGSVEELIKEYENN